MQMLRKACLGLALAGGVAVGATDSATAHGWTGLYVGGHIGGAWTDAQWDNVSLTNESMAFDSNGIIGGAHLGYLHQFNNLVVGVEVSYSGLDADNTVGSAVVPAAVTYRSQVDSLFMATARLGITSGNWLFYAKGGFASADIEYSGAQSAILDSFSQSHRNSGWVFGGGVEWLISKNLILGLEYNHITLNDRTLSGQTALAINYAISGADMEIDTVTARLSYKFGGRDEYHEPMK